MDTERALDLILEDVNRHYTIDAASITPAPRGYAADTYYLSSRECDYFLKITSRVHRYPLFMNGLRVVDALTRSGIDFIPRVIPAADGSLYLKKENGVYAIFEKINAVQTYEFDMKDAFEKLAAIYKASAQFPDKSSFLSETFHDGFIETYEKQLSHFFSSDYKYKEAEAARDILMPYASDLKSLPDEARAAVAASRSQKAPYYLTHSDFPGNIMVDSLGRQYMIDFDESLFGPLERDGWMISVRENEESRIWDQVMRQSFNDYAVNENFIRYYVYERFMVDLRDFLNDLCANPDAGYRSKVLRSLQDYLLGWLYQVLTRYRA
ncbi:MAG TPA: phosphotransferase [Candidatus Atribacteria bacterium]|nr:phosphotransferase [Candidatus Atribacteria bacterium]HPT77530.1 phosphotransferase [Candidatus Atribacteria bacterium]